MSDLVEYRKAIAVYFLANYTGLAADKIQMPNETFQPPEPSAGEAWAQFRIQEFVGQQESLGDVGSRKFERRGSILFVVHAPVDSGSKAADTLANEARDVLEGVTLSGSKIWLQGATVRHVGVEGAWYLVSMAVDFYASETK